MNNRQFDNLQWMGIPVWVSRTTDVENTSHQTADNAFSLVAEGKNNSIPSILWIFDSQKSIPTHAFFEDINRSMNFPAVDWKVYRSLLLTQDGLNDNHLPNTQQTEMVIFVGVSAMNYQDMAQKLKRSIHCDDVLETDAKKALWLKLVEFMDV